MIFLNPPTTICITLSVLIQGFGFVASDPYGGLHSVKLAQNNHYYISTFKANAREADNYCRLSSYKLLAIETSVEQQIIITELSIRNDVFGNVWTSGNDLSTEGNATWSSTEKRIVYENFAKPIANNRRRNCVALKKLDGLWYFRDCTKELYFICEF